MAKPAIKRDSKVSTAKYKQARNLTFYFNGQKRSGKDKREDAFLMVDDVKLIAIADGLREAEHEPTAIATILIGLMLKQGKLNMTFGDEIKASSDDSEFDVDAVLAEHAA